MAEKVGVYVCHCGSNIAGKVDVEEVAKWAGASIDDGVASVRAMLAIAQSAAEGRKIRLDQVSGEL